ncbi:hypothetical protein ACWDA7_40615 [Streptomyces sp. NPDC001156]
MAAVLTLATGNGQDIGNRITSSLDKALPWRSVSSPAKEGLFFDRQAEVESHLAALMRDRAPGTCPVEAIRDDLLAVLQQDDPILGLHPGSLRFWQVIHDSPALRAREREREIGEHSEAALAVTLAEHPPRAAGAHDSAGLPMPALLAGADAPGSPARDPTTHHVRRSTRTRTRRDRRCGASGMQPALLCLGLHPHTPERTSQQRQLPR